MPARPVSNQLDPHVPIRNIGPSSLTPEQLAQNQAAIDAIALRFTPAVPSNDGLIALIAENEREFLDESHLIYGKGNPNRLNAIADRRFYLDTLKVRAGLTRDQTAPKTPQQAAAE